LQNVEVIRAHVREHVPGEARYPTSLATETDVEKVSYPDLETVMGIAADMFNEANI